MARSLRSIVILAAAVLLSRCSGCGGDEPPCPSGQELCRGVCTDPATYANDPLNCGGCAISCGNGTCSGGACQCTAPAELCPTSNPRCADLLTDRLNCGTCGHACPRANDVCEGGTCVCPGPPFAECNGGAICTNTDTDPGNCGTCGNVCPLTNDVCVGGGCTCPAGLPNVCGSTCVNTDTDPSNCLGCGNVCATGASCSPTGCLCPTDESVCGTAPGVCVNTHTDEANCGSCGTVCATGATCTNSSCTCPQGTVACGGTQAGGKCCAGDACCEGTTCQPQHSNGVGGSYFDCAALGTYNVIQAEKAAGSWQPSGTEIPGVVFECPSCIGWRTPQGANPAFCGTWCYTGPLQGRVFMVQSLVCTCAGLNPGTWN